MTDNDDELDGDVQKEEIIESESDVESDAIMNEQDAESPRDNI